MTKREPLRFRVTGYSQEYAALYDPLAATYYVNYYSHAQERETRLEFSTSEVDRKVLSGEWEKLQ